MFGSPRRLVAVDPVPYNLHTITPLFRSRGLPLSVPVITGWVQYTARLGGESTYLKLFTARSLRIGGATALYHIFHDVEKDPAGFRLCYGRRGTGVPLEIPTPMGKRSEAESGSTPMGGLLEKN